MTESGDHDRTPPSRDGSRRPKKRKINKTKTTSHRVVGRRGSGGELIIVRDLHPLIFGSQERVTLVRGGVPGADVVGFGLVFRRVEQRRWLRRPTQRLRNTAVGFGRMLLV